MNQRGKVKNVIVTITNPGGQKETTVLPGDKCEGLFFNNRAVNKILAPFYKTNKSVYTRETLTDSCGSHALPLIKGKESLRITPHLVEELWNLEDQNGTLPPYLEKTTNCIIGIPEMKFSIPGGGRPTISGITVELCHVYGRNTYIPLNPAATEVLVWSDRAVLEILAPFYNTYESIFTREKLVESCGFNTLPLMRGSQQLRITPQLVEELWNLTDQQGILPPYMEKTNDCMPVIKEIKSILTLKAA